MSTEKEIRRCFKCGMCRAVCPVVEAELVETAGPRAKVALCEAVEDGRLGASRALLDILNKCTGCRACSLNCTSGTDAYGIAVLTRFEHMREEPHPRAGTGAVSEFVLDVLANPEKEIGAYATKMGLGTPRVAYFIGCVEARRLTVVPRNILGLFENLGIEIEVPERQVCCGWPYILLGRLDSAKKLALRNRKAFESFDVVLASCPHCLNALTSEYSVLLGIGAFEDRAKDVLTFLTEKNLHKRLEVRCDSVRILYSHPCRMGRGRSRETLHLNFLKEHVGSAVVKADGDLCCGAPLQLLSPALSQRMLRNKVNGIRNSGSSAVLSSCPFCVLAVRSSCDVPVRYLMESISVTS